MLEATPRKSTWVIHLLSIILFFLIAWLLSFVIDDLNDIGKPDDAAVYSQYVDQDLANERSRLKQQIKNLEQQINNSSQSLKNIQNASGGNTNENLVKFSNLLIEQESRKNDFLVQLEKVETEFAPQYAEYHFAWNKVWAAHRLWVAVYKLAFIIPVFILAAFVRSRRRASALRPIYTSMLIASFWHLGVIANDHFPEVVFKYIAIAVGIVIVLAALVHLLQRASAPKDLDLLNLRRAAYANSICACCAFPIRRQENSDYTCPSCGTELFAKCRTCATIRHRLLPYCASCGTE